MDIDIDYSTTFIPTTFFVNAIIASMIKNDKLVKHPCGYYFQTIPVDKITNLAAIPYDQAARLGYFKFDFLHLSLLDFFANKQEIRALLKIEPDWNLLLDKNNVAKLFQLHKHYDILIKVKPTSVQELADCIALIRPGKKHLFDRYINNKQQIRPMLYRQTGDDKSSFKKSHSIAYSLNIVLQLHLIKAGIL